MKNVRRILGTALAIVALVAAPVGANAAPAFGSAVSQQVASAENEITPLPRDIEESLFVPDSIVLLNQETGEVVEEIDPAAMPTPYIQELGPGCSTDSLCLYRSITNWGYGFVGAGTKSGNWTSVNKYGSKKYANQIWWKSGGSTVTGGKKPAGQLVLLTGNVTVSKVKIF